MSLHQERTHPVPQPDCFACKIAGISWGIVPGAYRDSNSDTMFDRDQLMTQIGHSDGRGSVFSEERIRDNQADFARHQKEFLDA